VRNGKCIGAMRCAALARLVLVALAKQAPHHLVAPPRLFLRVVSALDFHYISVERAFLVERGRRGRVGAVCAVVAAEASIAAQELHRLV
jgi:hypothetical protein